MQKVLTTLAIPLAILLAGFGANGLRAEGPVQARINRFFGIGWGDGYHVYRYGCGVGCNGLHDAEPLPGHAVIRPGNPVSRTPGDAAQPVVTPSNRSQIVNVVPPRWYPDRAAGSAVPGSLSSSVHANSEFPVPATNPLAPPAAGGGDPRMVRLPPVRVGF